MCNPKSHDIWIKLIDHDSYTIGPADSRYLAVLQRSGSPLPGFTFDGKEATVDAADDVRDTSTTVAV